MGRTSCCLMVAASGSRHVRKFELAVVGGMMLIASQVSGNTGVWCSTDNGPVDPEVHPVEHLPVCNATLVGSGGAAGAFFGRTLAAP